MVAAVTDDAYDWTRVADGDQRKLYDAIQGVVKARGLSWNSVFAQAFGHPGAVGKGYEGNLRKGRIAGKRAGQIFARLSAHYPDRAAALRWTLEGEHASAWETLIAGQAQVDDLDLIRLPDAPTGVVSFADLAPLAAPRLRLGERFCFALTGQFDGAVLALQAQRKRWFVLPLARHQPLSTLSGGLQHLPCDADVGTPIAFSETAITGLTRFACILVQADHAADLRSPAQLGSAIAPTVFNGLARDLMGLPRDAWRLLILDVQFTD
ncbi:MAG: hypothetical protein DI537_33655 [Stutzerimonas stutzeri]|nr:MAG: hypothetical protein DI537_33655 [Stutzerimonas stutzeri]